MVEDLEARRGALRVLAGRMGLAESPALCRRAVNHSKEGKKEGKGSGFLLLLWVGVMTYSVCHVFLRVVDVGCLFLRGVGRTRRQSYAKILF